MAKEDYQTPEVQDQADFTAAAVLVRREVAVDADAKALAEDAGVVDAAFVDYPEAIDRYQQRDDVETLEQRRARENGTAFSEANNLRALGEVEGVVTTRAVAEGKDSKVNVPADKQPSGKRAEAKREEEAKARRAAAEEERKAAEKDDK